MFSARKLKKARARIEAGWCQKTLAKAEDGCWLYAEKHWYGTKWWRDDNRVDRVYTEPVAYCVRGALLTANPDTKEEELLREALGSPITLFNDLAKDKQTVLDAYDFAILLAELRAPWYERVLSWIV
jgi:hypothetical protein